MGATDLPDTEIITALGTLVVNVSVMEESLHDALHVLSGSNNVAIGVLTAGRSFKDLVERLCALCFELKTCRLPAEDVKKYCTHLLKLNEQRNQMIHSTWYVADSGETRRYKRTATPNSGFLFRVTPVKADAILAVANQFVEAENKLWEIMPSRVTEPLNPAPLK